jgi:hypothetical protein
MNRFSFSESSRRTCAPRSVQWPPPACGLSLSCHCLISACPPYARALLFQLCLCLWTLLFSKPCLTLLSPLARIHVSNFASVRLLPTARLRNLLHRSLGRYRRGRGNSFVPDDQLVRHLRAAALCDSCRYPGWSESDSSWPGSRAAHNDARLIGRVCRDDSGEPPPADCREGSRFLCRHGSDAAAAWHTFRNRFYRGRRDPAA